MSAITATRGLLRLPAKQDTGRASGSRLKGASRTDIAKRVGHESIYITLHYSHAFKSVDNDIANSLDAQMEVLE